jgi:hypothetical protein
MDKLKFELAIVIDGDVEANLYDLGAITLQCEDRSYILDATSSYINKENGKTIFDTKVELDKETFDESCSRYDLTTADLFNPKLKATLFIGNDYEVEPESMTLLVTLESGDVYPIKLTNECE